MPGRNIHYALDIGAHALKLVRFFPGKPAQVLSTALHKLPSNPRSISIEKELSAFLGREEPELNKPIFVSLSSAQTFVRYIRLPEISEHKIKRIIAFEAEQQIPFPIDEVIWDYAVLDSPSSNKEHLAVLCAVRQSVASEVVRTLEQMRFSVKGILANSVALYHLFKQLGYERRRILVIDLGAQTTNVLIMNGGSFWSRALSLGSYKLRELIQEQKSVSPDEAEQMIRRIVMGETSKPEEKELKEIAGRFFYDLLNEITRTISFYHTQTGQVKFEQAFITGGLSLLDGLAGFFELNLGLTTRRLDSEQGAFAGGDLTSGSKSDFPLFSVALGLASGSEKNAVPSIRMISGELRSRLEAEWQRWRYLAISSVVLLILSLFVGDVYLERTTKREALAYEKARLAYYQASAEKEGDLATEADQLKEKLEGIRSEAAKKSVMADIFQELEARTPQSIWLVALEFESREKSILKIKGETFGSLGDINHFAEQLEQSPVFKSVEVVSAGIVEEKNAKEIQGVGVEGQKTAEDASELSHAKAARMFSLNMEVEPLYGTIEK